MLTSARQIATLLTVALAGCGVAVCGTINEKLAAGVSDAIPAAVGGLPADAPPRPGTAKYASTCGSARESACCRLPSAAKRPSPRLPPRALANSSTVASDVYVNP